MADDQQFTSPQDFTPNFEPATGGFEPVVDTNINQTPPQPNPDVASVDQFAYFDPSVQPQQPSFEQPTQQFNQAPAQDFNFDPNGGYGSAQYNDTSFTGVDPSQATGLDQFGNPVNQGFSDPYMTPSVDSGFQTQPVQEAAQEVNSFIEKKTGNKGILFGAIGAAVVLLGLAGFFIFNNLQSNKKTDDTPKQSVTQTETKKDETPKEIDTKAPDADDTLTGGSGSFATKARKYNVATTPTDWNLKKFYIPNINSNTGECQNVSFCGPSADPDRDGSKNIDEYNFDTDPTKADSDLDQIADGDELFVYFTDPTKDDTDLDTFDDGQEIAGCYNPTENGKGIKYNVESIAVLKEQTSLIAIHEPTVTLLTGAAATNSDITDFGIVSKLCGLTEDQLKSNVKKSDNTKDTSTTNSSAVDNDKSTSNTTTNTTTNKKSTGTGSVVDTSGDDTSGGL
jgi:hypothetical protein